VDTPSPEPPATRREPIVEILHGVRVEDPYRWLEDGDDPEVQSWTREQGRHTRERLEAVPGRDALRRRLAALLAVGSISPPSPHRGRYFYLKRSGTQEQPVLYVREGLRGADRVLLDPARLSSDGASALDWFYPSPDGRLVAYGLSEGGSEQSTLRVLDVDGGADVADAIPWTRACSLEWLPDRRGFIYTRYPEPGTVPAGEEDYHRAVFEHRLGADWRDDAPIFGESLEAEDWPQVHLSPDGRWLGVSVSKGWTRTDVYLRDRAGDSGFVPVAQGTEVLYGVTLRNDRLYLHTNLDAPRYRLLAADPARPGRESWRELIPEGGDVLEGACVVGGRILALRLEDASSRLALHDLAGRKLQELDLPSLGSVAGIAGEWDSDEVFFGFSSYTRPPAVQRVDLASGALEVWQRVAADLDADAYAVRLERCRSRDGTAVSMFLVHRKDRPEDGSGPALLTGYGGFGVSHTPAFGRGLIALLERGGLYAVAHLRGGGEYGEAWHRAGMLERKQDVFDDFVAAAEHLVSRKLAAPDRLGMLGGSNGGLLVGAALTQRPELFRAAVCQVPLLDMLRYHRFRIARLWIPEYGSPDEADAFRWLHAYSPYHRVVDGTAYPAVLLTTGESDSRVDPMHARKMAARLQAASASGRPVLLRVEARAGHGQGKPLSKALEEWTDVWCFLFAELGIGLRPEAPG
jgi:prolyl oligopeptidase